MNETAPLGENKAPVERQYRCLTTCQFKGRIWHPGDIFATTDENDVPPHHFEGGVNPKAILVPKPEVTPPHADDELAALRTRVAELEQNLVDALAKNESLQQELAKAVVAQTHLAAGKTEIENLQRQCVAAKEENELLKLQIEELSAEGDATGKAKKK